ncbi:MAG TPA: TerB family tellurite resistance protein [Bacteroidia bacterium]|nr:TerB family tellurite resistance protein [Bacteroidia bacterium]
MFKFIGAALGYFLFRGFFGSILGFIIGSAIDNALSSGKKFNGDEFDYYRQHATGPHNDFATMLMVLSASVMRADGKVLKAELDFIKTFFSQQFGPRFTREHLQVLKHFLDGAEIPLERICSDIRQRAELEVRIQLLYYLFGLAKADGHVAEAEILVIRNIARLLEIPSRDFESVKNMFWRDTNSDYRVLEIEPEASDDEVKKAYRQMAVRYHPDKVAHMGEEYQKGAKEKFQKIQEAYENIKKQRKFV